MFFLLHSEPKFLVPLFSKRTRVTPSHDSAVGHCKLSMSVSVSEFDVRTAEGLRRLDLHLSGRKYVNGPSFCSDDLRMFQTFKQTPDPAHVPNVARWYNHIASEFYSSSPSPSPSPSSPSLSPSPSPSPKEQTNSKAAEKSVVIIDVMPQDDVTPIHEIESAVRQITLPGLEWHTSETVPVAYGLCKLRMTCVVVDTVSVDEVQERIEAFEDIVRSTDILAFSRLST